MARRAALYNALFGLRSNPFPDNPIATASAVDPFDPFLHPEIPPRLAKVFLGPARRRPPNIYLLWSLGQGEGARGFGKTSYLQWFTRSIRQDFGATLLRLCDGK